MQFSCIWPIHRTLSGASTPGQSGPGSDGNEGELCISESLALLEPHHQIVQCKIQFYTSAKMQSVYSTVQADMARLHLWRELRLTPNESPVYYIKQFDGEAPALPICGRWRTSSLPLLPGLDW